MTIWTGWEDQFLAAAGVKQTAANRRFLDDWHTHAQTNCTNNPVDLSAKEPGSSNCGALLPGPGPAQRYAAHTDAARAFATQIHRASAKPILDALKTGNPYTVSNPADVGAALTTWGSQTFERPYLNETVGPPGKPPPKPPPRQLKAPQALGGWKDLQRTVNHHMPDTLRESARNRDRALRQVARARKVLR